MPVNWYAALVIIVIIGIASIAVAKYNYNQTAAVVEPAVGTSWHAALAFDICGTMEPDLPATTPTSTNGLVAAAGGVMVIHPATSSQAGNNATLGKFASEYTGLTLTDSSVKYPGATEYTNGQKCAAKTPDAGKKGVLRVRTWVLATTASNNGSFSALGGQYAPSPTGLKLLDRQLITVGFGPSSQDLPKPSQSTITALEHTLEGVAAPVTTTTTPATTTPTTSAATVPSTTAPTTTTTTPATTTTKPTTTTTRPTTTTTAKPS